MPPTHDETLIRTDRTSPKSPVLPTRSSSPSSSREYPLELDRDRGCDSSAEISARPFADARSICAIIVTVLQALTTDLVGRRTLFLGSVVVTWVVLLIVGGMGLIPNKSAALNKLVVSARAEARKSELDLVPGHCVQPRRVL